MIKIKNITFELFLVIGLIIGGFLCWGVMGERIATGKGYDEKVIVQSISECNDCDFESRYQVRLSNGKVLKLSSLSNIRYDIEKGNSIHIRYENGEIEYAGKGTANVKKRINGKLPESKPSITDTIILVMYLLSIISLMRGVRKKIGKRNLNDNDNKKL